MPAKAPNRVLEFSYFVAHDGRGGSSVLHGDASAGGAILSGTRFTTACITRAACLAELGREAAAREGWGQSIGSYKSQLVITSYNCLRSNLMVGGLRVCEREQQPSL